MYKITDITNNPKQIKKIYTFFKDATDNELPSLKRYSFYVSIGKAYGIYDGNTIVGGLVMYAIKTHNVIVNYLIPEDARNKTLALETLELIIDFKTKHGGKKIYIKSNDISTYKRFVRHVEDDYYEIMIPDRRWK